MTTKTNIQNQAFSQAAAVVARPSTRLAYLDTLRAILISLVIALHTAIAYGAVGDWTYVDPAKSEIAGILLTFVTTIVQAFSLGLYFFISGYFTPGSYDRKGGITFWKDRLLRLGLPMLVYTFALNRIPNYFAGVARGEFTISFWKYFSLTFFRDADEGPTWFIFALLLFLVGYTIWRLATNLLFKQNFNWLSKIKTPGKIQILSFGLIVSVLMFLIGLKSKVGDTIEVFGIFNLMTIFFAQYILFFIAGVLAYRNNWLSSFTSKDIRFWAWFTLGVFMMMPVLFFVGGAAAGTTDIFIGGLYWQSAAFMVWIGLFSVSFSMLLILWLRDRKSRPSRWMTFAGPNSYAVYLIHPLVLVPMTVVMTPVLISPLLKFIIVLPVVLLLCFLVAEILRRIPGLKSIL